MKCKLIKMTGLLLAFMAGSSTAFAQSYDPTPPDEPQTPVFPDPVEKVEKYAVIVKAADPKACSVSGGGMYEAGTSLTVNASANSPHYVFSHWTKNGVTTSLSQQFAYIVKKGEDGVVFEAHFAYDPVTPAEPATGVTSRLYLESNLEGACSFNRTNGAMSEVDQWVTVTVYPNANFTFCGWYNDETLVSSSLDYSFAMPYHDTKLVARFTYTEPEPEPLPEYDPTVPGEPGMADGQHGVDGVLDFILGDIDGNGVITISDITELIKQYLQNDNSTAVNPVYDIDSDGHFTISDITMLIKIYLAK